MSIEHFYTTTFTLQRFVFSNDSSAMATGTSFDGHLQQVRAELAQQQGFQFGELFHIWCDIDTDVERSDRLTYGVNTYDIQDIKELLVGGNKHLQLTVTLHNIE